MYIEISPGKKLGRGPILVMILVIYAVLINFFCQFAEASLQFLKTTLDGCF